MGIEDCIDTPNDKKNQMEYNVHAYLLELHFFQGENKERLSHGRWKHQFYGFENLETSFFCSKNELFLLLSHSLIIKTLKTVHFALKRILN